MLVNKLWNGNFSIDILQDMIKLSTKSYNNLLLECDNISNNFSAILSFISDDIYEFDTIARFAKTMIDIGIDQNKWGEILNIIRQYNNSINNNQQLFKKLQCLQAMCQKNSNEYKFISKMINGTLKNGINLKSTKFGEVNDKINSIEKNLLTDFLENSPIIKLDESELDGVPSELIHQFYDSESKKYTIKLDKNMYTICNKFVRQSTIRHKIDTALHENYQKNIPKLAYLFVYKHVKANMLGYSSYLSCITKHSPEEMQNILNTLISDLSERCDVEASILSNLKNTYEIDPTLYTWDIAYYVNKWKMIYGINESDISPYFEIKHTTNKIFELISAMFQITFVRHDNYKKWNPQIETYKIIKNKNVIGEVTFDLYERCNKITGNHTVCVSNRCNYPNAKKNEISSSLIVHMNIPNSEVVLLSLSDLCALLNEFGKVVYYVSGVSNYSLFGGMYSDVETVDSIGKFVELALFTGVNLKKISHHFNNGSQLSDRVVEKIIHHKKLEYGLAYKYQCLYGLYDLFVHSQLPFIDDCKKFIKIADQSKRKNAILNQMFSIYNSMYDAIFNYPDVVIHKDPSHFHPIIWTYLFSGNENTNFMRILSDMHAHELLSIYSERECKEFCELLTNFISQNSQNDVNLDQFIEHPVSAIPMLSHFGHISNEISQSLYNIEMPQKNQMSQTCKPNLEPTSRSQCNRHGHINYFEQLSENDPRFKEIIDKVMK